MKTSAGIIFYRKGRGDIEIVLVHPSGAYNRHAPWSIPKGELLAGEDFAQAARREALEETGLLAHSLLALGFVDLPRSRKRIYAFACENENGEPKCASWEVDRAEFLPIQKARECLHSAQRPLLDRLSDFLAHQVER